MPNVHTINMRRGDFDWRRMFSGSKCLLPSRAKLKQRMLYRVAMLDASDNSRPSDTSAEPHKLPSLKLAHDAGNCPGP